MLRHLSYMLILGLLLATLGVAGCDVGEDGDIYEEPYEDTTEPEPDTTTNTCGDDGVCNIECSYDVDCKLLDCEGGIVVDEDEFGAEVKGCNYNDGICEAQDKCVYKACFCDPDCTESASPCESDGHCDSWCPTDMDLDCADSTNNGKYCE